MQRLWRKGRKSYAMYAFMRILRQGCMTTYSIWGPANFPSLEMPLTDSSVNQPHTESREYRSSPPPEREKSVYIAKSVPKSKNPDARKNVEVLYDDGKWYRG